MGNVIPNVSSIPQTMVSGMVGESDNIHNIDTNFIVEIDSDLSHHPKDILKGINLLKTGEYDLVVASKYNKNSVVKNKFIRIYSSEFITVYLNKKINKNNAFKIINNAAGSNTSRLIKFLIMLVFRKVFKK